MLIPASVDSTSIHTFFLFLHHTTNLTRLPYTICSHTRSATHISTNEIIAGVVSDRGDGEVGGKVGNVEDVGRGDARVCALCVCTHAG